MKLARIGWAILVNYTEENSTMGKRNKKNCRTSIKSMVEKSRKNKSVFFVYKVEFEKLKKMKLSRISTQGK